MMNSVRRLYTKIIQAGDPHRKSRFHTLQGNCISPAGLRSLPRCLFQTFVFQLSGRRPLLPWIPYSALNFLLSRMQPQWQVLEIGSGMSTLWLAQNCAKVDSIEADQDWVSLLRAEIQRRQISNTRILYRWQADHMCDFRDWPDESLDLLFIDGGPRPACLLAGFPKVKPSGFIYVDNTDIEKTSADSARILHQLAETPGASLRVFRGFVPCNFFVNEGMLLQKASSPA